MAVTYAATHKPDEVVNIPRALIDAANSTRPNGHTVLSRKTALLPTCYAGVRRTGGYSSCQSYAAISRFVPEQPNAPTPAILRYLCWPHREAASIIVPIVRKGPSWKNDF